MNSYSKMIRNMHFSQLSVLRANLAKREITHPADPKVIELRAAFDEYDAENKKKDAAFTQFLRDAVTERKAMIYAEQMALSKKLDECVH